MKAIIIGASGGIGRALVNRLAPDCETVIALSRSGADFDHPHVQTARLDMSDEDALKEHSQTLKSQGPFDLIICATGFLHNEDIKPEKSMRALSQNALLVNYQINAIGPVLVAKYFLPLLPRGQRGVFAALSARVGSISDNRLGGWYSYRASKVALNMLLKTLAIEHGRRHKDHIILGLHPGTVNTALSEPFQGNVPDGKLFTPDYSAEQLLRVIQGATPQNSGEVFAWDGSRVEP